MEDEKKPITTQDLLKLKEQLNKHEPVITHLKFIPNDFLPDDTVWISRKLYDIMKSKEIKQ